MWWIGGPWLAQFTSTPGEYKTQQNRAGSTKFVAPDLVRGTLGPGLKALLSLATPFQRSVFMMFLVAEVHPFSDGNGRLSRIMMDAERRPPASNALLFRPSIEQIIWWR